MIEELSNIKEKNEVKSTGIVSAYYKKLLPQIREESKKLEDICE
jgi:hypothetical protein